jgi:hypothetical protein
MAANSTLSVNDGYVRNVRGFYLIDWDDKTGGSDNKYRLLARDGAWMYYNGGVVVGSYMNGTWTDVPDGYLIVESRIGIGTSGLPVSNLHVVGGAICASDDTTTNCDNTPGALYSQTATVQQADYAEYFISEQSMSKADIVGLNIISGKIRKYRMGDKLIGVVSTEPGFIGNSKIKNKMSIAVALLGQVPFNKNQVKIINGVVFTKDNKQLGYLLARGDVYINIGSNNRNSELNAKTDFLESRINEKEAEIALLKEENEELNSRLAHLEKMMKQILASVNSGGSVSSMTEDGNFRY